MIARVKILVSKLFKQILDTEGKIIQMSYTVDVVTADIFIRQIDYNRRVCAIISMDT